MSTRTAALRARPAATPRTPRRVSGPARVAAGATARPAARHVPRGRTAPAASRRRQSTDSFAAIARIARRVPDARVLDRLVRGRLWIGIIAVGLVLLVFMQVSLLKLNTGISSAITTSQTLERQNAEMRASVSQLDSGQRIQDLAARQGMVMPDASQLRFLAAQRPGDAERAATAMTAPDPQAAALRAQAIIQLALQREQAAAAALQASAPGAAQAPPGAAAAPTATATARATATTPAGTPAPAPTTAPTGQGATGPASPTVTPPAQASAPGGQLAPTGR